MATLKSGFAILSYQKNGANYDYRVVKNNLLPSQNFNSSGFDHENNLWLGTLNNGAVRINDINTFYKDIDIDYSLFKFQNRQLRISCFSTTSNNRFWVGSFDKGIFRFDLKKKSIQRI
ncbi:hypothetical protein ACU8V7_08645 [Zobellia nedashkovskayae]